MVASPPALRTDAERRRFVRYTRTQQWPMLQRFPVADELHVELLAQMLACPPVRAAAFVDSLREEARATAARMVADERFRAALAALPFGAGDRIVAIGDSITADRVGWVELLAAATEITGSAPAVLHNLGISGNTTADVLERFDLVEALRPSLVLLMLGTNDARSHGRGSSHRMVTPEETERNLRALIELVTVDLKAAVTVVTPPAVDPARVTGYFAGQPLRWEAITVAEVAAIVRAVAPDCLDLHTAMLEHGLADLIEDDGVHPTIAGQRFILERVVAHLTMAGRR